MGNVCFRRRRPEPSESDNRVCEDCKVLRKASFSMQCFWDPEAYFGVQPGVIRTQVGYSGGTTKNPTYQDIGDHTETVEVVYDPAKTSYENLLQVFWEHCDPVTQFNNQYKSIIFYHTTEQRRVAVLSIKDHQQNYEPSIITEIVPASRFYPAENYHQKFRLQSNPKLMKMLKLSGHQLRESRVAARLNGYVCRFGSLQMFEAELAELELDPELADYVRSLLTNS